MNANNNRILISDTQICICLRLFMQICFTDCECEANIIKLQRILTLMLDLAKSVRYQDQVSFKVAVIDSKCQSIKRLIDFWCIQVSLSESESGIAPGLLLSLLFVLCQQLCVFVCVCVFVRECVCSLLGDWGCTPVIFYVTRFTAEKQTKQMRRRCWMCLALWLARNEYYSLLTTHNQSVLWM